MKSIALICHTPQAFNGQNASTLGLGGVETSVVGLSEALAALGHPMSVYTTAAERLTHKGVNWHPMEDVGAIEAEVVIVCNHVYRFNHLKPEVAKRAHKIVWLHNPLQVEKAVRKGDFLPMVQHRPDVVFLGDYLSRTTSCLLPFKRRHVIGYGIAAPFLQTPHKPLSERSNRVVWVSQPQRGLVETLALWKDRVLPAVPDAEFHLFGRSAHDTKMTEDELKRLRVVLQPRATKQQLADFYATAKLLWYPGARDETFCLAAAEAQCMGVPVVTRGIGSLSERVQHNTNGLIGKTDEPFAQAAIDVLKNETLWNNLSTGALKQRDMLNWNAVAKRWQAIFL
jgi:glycosyltransferase involved in cell wall biosynthesis